MRCERLRDISDVRNEPSGDVSIAEADGFCATFDGPTRAISSGFEVVDRVRELGIEIR
jgi:hypothetical protein